MIILHKCRPSGDAEKLELWKDDKLHRVGGYYTTNISNDMWEDYVDKNIRYNSQIYLLDDDEWERFNRV